MSLQANLEKTIASKKKTAPVAQPTDAASTADPAAETPAPNAPALAKQMANASDADLEIYASQGKAPGTKDAAVAEKQRRSEAARTSKTKKSAAPSQAKIDADRERNIGITSDSIIRTDTSLSETLSRKVQEQKQRMFETALMAGTQSVFKK
jgi:hypothetical protein